LKVDTDKLKNLKSGTLIIALCLAISVMGIIASLVGYAVINKVGEGIDRFQDDADKVAMIADLQLTVGQSMMPVNDVIITGDLEEVQNYKEIRAVIDGMVADIEKYMTSPEEEQLLASAKEGLLAADVKAQEVFDVYDKKEAAEAMEDYDAVVDKAVEGIGLLRNRLGEEQESAKNMLDGIQDSSKSILLFIMFLNIAVSAGAIFYILKKVISPLRASFMQIVETVRSVAVSSGEISHNSDAVNQATNQIASAISQVASGASEQSRSTGEALMVTEQMKSAIEQVASGAQSQALSVSDTVIGVGKLVEAIGKVTKNANTVSNVASATKETASQGKETVGKAIDGMQRIKETVLSSANKIQTLGEKSKQIGEIIEVIDDIAEQTNLLALNAAIEAARAGEHGKGFAVVADEVRKLAERSAKATGEIADLIKGIQDETMHAVGSMESGMSEVEQGSELAENAGSAITEMMEAISEVVNQINEVSSAASQMATASEQVSRAMDQIASVTEQNTAATQQVAASIEEVANSINSVAATAEESAASVEEVSASTEEQAASVGQISMQVQSLANMADELNERVAKFNL